MTTKQKVAIILIILSVAFLVGLAITVKAAPTVPQTPQAYTMQGTAAHTTCTTPASGAYFLCVATDGIWVSNNGGQYFQIVPQAAQAAGVTSLSVNGGAAQTGAVALKIPTSVTINQPTGTIQ